MITGEQALAVVVFGALCVIGALVWRFGWWGLFGSGLVLIVVALLAPVRERRGEPAEPAAPPA